MNKKEEVTLVKYSHGVFIGSDKAPSFICRSFYDAEDIKALVSQKWNNLDFHVRTIKTINYKVVETSEVIKTEEIIIF